MVHKPDRSGSWMWKMWFDGKQFSSLNHMKSTVPLTAAACSASDRRRDWFQTAAVRDVVWHSWAGDRDVYNQSVNASFTWDLTIQLVHFWIVFLTEHKVFDILSFSLTHTERGLPLPGCRSIVPALRIFFNTFFYFHILSICYESVWQILGLKELMWK